MSTGREKENVHTATPAQLEKRGTINLFLWELQTTFQRPCFFWCTSDKPPNPDRMLTCPCCTVQERQGGLGTRGALQRSPCIVQLTTSKLPCGIGGAEQKGTGVLSPCQESYASPLPDEVVHFQSLLPFRASLLIVNTWGERSWILPYLALSCLGMTAAWHITQLIFHIVLCSTWTTHMQTFLQDVNNSSCRPWIL